MTDINLLRDSYNHAYQRKGPLFGLRPDPALVALVREKELSGVALDIGAGDGRHATLLARHGFFVEAIDLSEAGTERLRQLARRAHLSINARVADITSPEGIAGSYDLIVADTLLGHFPLTEAAQIGEHIVKALAPGGWLFVTVLAKDDPRESEFAALSKTYFSAEELVELFPGLLVERCEELSTTDRTHGPPHRHRLLRLIAHKEDS